MNKHVRIFLLGTILLLAIAATIGIFFLSVTAIDKYNYLAGIPIGLALIYFFGLCAEETLNGR